MNADVLIAVRGGSGAKSRLAGRLEPEQREALVEAMLADMLAALAGCRAVLRTYVTTPTPSLARRAAQAGAVVIAERDTGDLNAAFDHARRRIARARPDGMLALLPGDLPQLDPAELEACLDVAGLDRLVLAPAWADGGTGAMVLRADVPFQFAFGPDSFGKHLASARKLGLSTQVVRASSLGFDIDRPGDFDALRTMGGGGATAELVRSWRVAA